MNKCLFFLLLFLACTTSRAQEKQEEGEVLPKAYTTLSEADFCKVFSEHYEKLNFNDLDDPTLLRMALIYNTISVAPVNRPPDCIDREEFISLMEFVSDIPYLLPEDTYLNHNMLYLKGKNHFYLPFYRLQIDSQN